MTLTPLNGRVVVRRLNTETVSRGGIVLPESAQKKSSSGVVVHRSAEWTSQFGHSMYVPVSEGDTVLFPEYSGEEVVVDGEKLVMLRSEDLLAKVNV